MFERLTGLTIDALVRRGLVLGSEGRAGKLPRHVAETMGSEISGEGGRGDLLQYFDVEDGQWRLPRWDLNEIKVLSPRGILQRYVERYGPLQDMALFWPQRDGVSMNGHGAFHVATVWDDAMDLMRLAGNFNENDERIVALATCFHDVGLSFGAEREEHAGVSLETMEAVVVGFSYQDDFCARTAELVACHVTNQMTQELVKDNPLLAVLILADEAHLERRVTAGFDQAQYYRSDRWVRLSTHIVKSYFGMEEGRLIWNIVTDGQEADWYAQAGVGGSLVEEINEVVFAAKVGLYQDCVKAIFGGEAQLGVRINRVRYNLDGKGLEI